MKGRTKWGINVIVGMACVMPYQAYAEDFFNTIDHSVTTNTTTGISTLNATINGANVVGSWQDTNLDGNLDVNEVLVGTIKLYDKDTATTSTPTLQTPAGVTNRALLETWAEQNAATILNIVFPGGLEDVTGATSETTLTQATFSKKVLKKVMPLIQQEAALSNFKGALEYQSLDINDDSGNAYSLQMGYAHDFESGYQLGFTMPYRYSDLDDGIDTESHYLGLDLYLKKAVKEWDDMSWYLGGELFGSITYVTSDAIEHAGSLKYGAGIFTSFDMELPVGNLSFGVDCTVSKAYLPSSLIDDGDNDFLKEVVDWVNDLEAVTTITYGINYGIPFNDNMAVNLEVVRSNYISDDILDGREAQTIAGISFAYYPTESFSIDIGIHNSFELEDIDVFGVVLGAVYKF